LIDSNIRRLLSLTPASTLHAWFLIDLSAVAPGRIGKSMLILRAQILLGSKPVGKVGAVSGAPGEKKFVSALADHLGAMLAYLG
jgi:hypothetical protein